MNNMTVFESVVTGDVSPEAAAAFLIEKDAERRKWKRPSWMPAYAWPVAVGLVCALLAVIGIRTNQS
jgi:hypothetical protein